MSESSQAHHLFCGFADRRTSACGAPSTSGVGIPAAFTDKQAEMILMLASLHDSERGLALKLLSDLTPELFSKDQAECIRHLLILPPQDFRATLIDALEPCRLPHRLRSQLVVDLDRRTRTARKIARGHE